MKIYKKLNEKTIRKNYEKIMKFNATTNFRLYEVETNVNKLLYTLPTEGEDCTFKFAHKLFRRDYFRG